MSTAVGRLRMSLYLRQFQQEFKGGSWNDEHYTGKLEALDEKKAFLQPAPGKHSVAEILWHCTYWRTVLIKRIEGDLGYRDRTAEKMNFLPLEELRTKGWKSLREEFFESQNRIAALLETNDDDFLDRVYQEGKTYEYIVEGIIHHDIYHLGQIGLVLSILKGS